MSDFTSKIKCAVDKATSVARNMAQDATDMKDKPEDSHVNVDDVEDGFFEMQPEEHQCDERCDSSDKRYGPNDEPYDPINSRYDSKEERFDSNADRFAAASEFDMSPVSQESQKLAGSMEKELMDSDMREQGTHSRDQEAMGGANLPTSQYMPDSPSAGKRS
ncbi:uncharacterized protein DNG_01275 [Cephalotrichum gorgonifer]|uniref:Uncharacterized protein n=1 Tax=Cephalotrichum gorgonifer TaxID=2041049 RepID=A0AAE8MQM9_9PEZI|nr:uncharacterized protein DNG_01275 [Cephalotrichum gorgonifer]